MCGISILVDKKNVVVDSHLVKMMNTKVVHRGPDDEGVYVNGAFGLGHRRLSILDLSAAGHQPMSFQNLTITYNGEIYNYVELKSELQQLGYSFKTNTDTEVILIAYHHWGKESFARLNGMWAFCISDSNTNELVLCRDHFGIKPLYFTHTSGFFAAASEIKQFYALPDFEPILNKEAAANFLAKGLLNYSEKTFFENVNELRPGHYLVYDLTSHTASVSRWYDLAGVVKKVGDNYEAAVKRTRELFVKSVKMRMRSDVKVGSCLSGGIDSSSIVSVIHSEKLANDSFATVTSCYTDSRYDEQQFSNQVTAETGFISVKAYPQMNDLLNGVLDKMIYHQDQPFIGATHFSEYKVFETAKSHELIVMLDGQGSDEFLCGYGEFYIARIKELLRKFKFRSLYQLVKAKAAHKGINVIGELRNVSKPLILFNVAHLINKYRRKANFPALTKEWNSLVHPDLPVSDKDICDLSIEEITSTSIPYQLHSQDRNAMMFSIESRVPFLDHELVEYILGLPSDYKIRDGYTKAILRDAVNELPLAIKQRKDKMGFVAPDEVWMRENSGSIRNELKLVVQEFDFIFTDELIDRFDKFIDGRIPFEGVYFRAITFRRFCHIFNMKFSNKS